MISTLEGTLRETDPVVVIDVGGVGFEVRLPESSRLALGEVGGRATLFTHLAVREDSLTLYGFVTRRERELFLLLLGVNGVGPRLALAILSALSSEDLARAIEEGGIATLTSVSGVGRKTAQRIVLDLKEKVGRHPPGARVADGGAPAGVVGPSRQEALLALLNLGLQRAAADEALDRVTPDEVGGEAAVEEWVRAALRHTRV